MGHLQGKLLTQTPKFLSQGISLPKLASLSSHGYCETRTCRHAVCLPPCALQRNRFAQALPEIAVVIP
jgi:hypothetical protein